MKKICLILLMICFCVTAQAKVYVKVLGHEKTSDGFIIIRSQPIDDKNTTDLSDDENVGTEDIRIWNPLSWESKTNLQRRDDVINDLQIKLDANVEYQFLKKYVELNNGDHPLDVRRKAIVDTVFNEIPDLTGITLELNNTTRKIDTNKDGLCDEEWTLNPNGTYISVSITPIEC